MAYDTPTAPTQRIPVENHHPDYDEQFPRWKRCRDVSAGQDAVHAAGELYLPRLGAQEDNDYKSYKMRAYFFNASWRTIVGLQGMLFRLPPKIKVPDAVQPYLENIDLKGTPFVLQLINTTEEALITGRVGILVDFPVVNDPENKLTRADTAAMNLRPTMGVYRAESIIDWQTRTINNKTVLSQVRLEECAQIVVDEFTVKEEKRWRVLDLVNTVDTESAARSVAYRVRLFHKNARGEQEQIGIDIYPEMDGKVLDFIPFYPIGVDSNSLECDEPPLIDLVDLNLAHYRVSADYEHGCHFTGLPTPYIAGHKAKENAQGVVIEKYTIGSTRAWVFPNADTKVGFLEFTGGGLSELRTNLDEKKKEMAVLGARMLEEKMRQVESADSASQRHGGENSVLASISQSISLGMKAALLTFARWGGANVPDGSDALDFDLNREFFPEPLDYNMLTALVAAWQKSAMSFETLFENLQRREVFPKDATAEDEQAKIDSEGPKLASLLGAGASLFPGMPPPPGLKKPAATEPPVPPDKKPAPKAKGA